MKLFFSHSSSQKPLVREIGKNLPKWCKVWIDEYDLNYGENLPTSLKYAIEDNVDYVIVLISEETLDSDWVEKEIEWALNHEDQLDRIFIIPILVGLSSRELRKFSLNERLAISIKDLTEQNIKSIAEKLVLSLSRLMDKRLHEQKVVFQTNSYTDTVNDIYNNLLKIPLEFQEKVDELLLHDLSIASQFARFGEIHIYPSVYYRMLLERISRADGKTEVYAVSLLKPNIWSNLDDQLEYTRKNYLAIKKGATIKRLFLIFPEDDGKFRNIIEEQRNKKIQIKINRPHLNSTSHLEDFVIFKNENKLIVLIGHQDRENSKGGLLSSRVIISEKRCKNYLSEFNKAWQISENNIETLSPIMFSDAPGRNMRVFKIDEPVISCNEAAKARKIPLENELKSLILETSKGRYIVHIPGDSLVDLRRVKNFLDVKQAYILDPEKLAFEYDLSPGRVSAVLEPAWSLHHLVSKRLLTLDKVYTNNKTLVGYFEFSPSILMQAQNANIGEFEKM